MFQVEPILWLQSLGSTPVTALLSLVTLLGYTPVYVALLLLMAFAHRLRPSLAVLGGVLLCGLLTEGLKDAVAYPRPDEIDARVRTTFATTPLPLAESGGAAGFWAAPRQQAVAAVRQRASGNYGFPSGHVAAATAFLLCTAYFFHSQQAALFATAWVPLMALSRMYLGRHFLADVLGGLAVGLLATGLAVLLFRALDEETFQRGDRRARLDLLPVTVVALVLLVLTPSQPLLRPEYVGLLVGLVVSYGFLLVTGLPADGGSPLQRAARAGVGALSFLAGVGLLRLLVHLVGRPARLTPLAAAVLVSTATFAGTVWLSRRLALYPGDARDVRSGAKGSS